MLKPKMTQSYVKANSNPYCIGYCNLQNLLKFRNPSGYTCGAYGWNADIYEFCDFSTNITLVTGYRPFGKSVDFDIQERYEKIAETVNKYFESNGREERWSDDYYTRWREALNIVIRAFLREISRNGYYSLDTANEKLNALLDEIKAA